MYYGEKRVENPIRWGMVGGGRGSQIGYIHRSAALRDFNFELVRHRSRARQGLRQAAAR